MDNPAPEKGLDIAKEYWQEWGRPWLVSRYPELLSNLGVGLFCGSDVLVVEDCCAAGTMELHDKELEIINMIYCQVASLDETVGFIAG